VAVRGRERTGKKCGDRNQAAQRTSEWSPLEGVMVEEWGSTAGRLQQCQSAVLCCVVVEGGTGGDVGVEERDCSRRERGLSRCSNGSFRQHVELGSSVKRQ